MQHVFRPLAFALLLSAASLRAVAQHETHEHEPRGLTAIDIGAVDFATSCAPSVEGTFNRAVSLLHSFWFLQARNTFEEVLKTDPDCAIAHWGIALTYWGNPFAGSRTAEAVALGRQAIDMAQGTGKPTPRERGYIDAVAILFSSKDPATYRDRIVRYESAMRRVADEHRGDVEAQIFYALALAQAALPDDKTYARQVQAGAILEPLFVRIPRHPGIAHYIIHAYDVPPLASKALPAARVYADIAPAVPHALHMPSHTFTRVGMWQQSVATNMRSAEAAERGNEPGAVLHALDYMTYAYLQMAMDSQAAASLDRLRAVIDATSDPAVAAMLAGSFPAVSMPARYALDREQWADAASLPTPAVPMAPYVEAINRFARALGAARSGRLDAVPSELARLDVLQRKTLDMKDAYWAGIIDIQRRSATAWHLFAQGKHDDAVAMMRAAADAEDATEKSVVTPGPLAPAREMLGFMLLEAGKPVDALVAFDAAIAKEPNRFLALYGAGRAAEQAKQRERAKGYYDRVIVICADAPAERPELVYVRGWN